VTSSTTSSSSWYQAGAVVLRWRPRAPWAALQSALRLDHAVSERVDLGLGLVAFADQLHRDGGHELPAQQRAQHFHEVVGQVQGTLGRDGAVVATSIRATSTVASVSWASSRSDSRCTQIGQRADL
jgi:alkanesulfonate monooxygenase SsuD/methylene tetrahydromethanopterin reductase-like flavin-dependent oxidoreductase (luciferase family)